MEELKRIRQNQGESLAIETELPDFEQAVVFFKEGEPGFQMLFYYLKDREIAKEEAQEVLLKISRKWKEIDENGRKKYFFKVARNHAIDFLRSKRDKIRQGSIFLEERSEIPFFSRGLQGIEKKIFTKEILKAINEVLSFISERHANILRLIFFEELSMDDLMQIPLASGNQLYKDKNSLYKAIFDARQAFIKKAKGISRENPNFPNLAEVIGIFNKD